MGITSASKVVDRSEVSCGGEFQVTLALAAAPDIIESPTDIVLVLDCSGSMSGVPLAAVKEGSGTFPAHTQPGCRDVQVQCIRFVVPEDMSLWGKSLCDTRRFQVQVIAQAMDGEFRCL